MPVQRCGTEGRTGPQRRKGGNGDENREGSGDENKDEDEKRHRDMYEGGNGSGSGDENGEEVRWEREPWNLRRIVETGRKT